MCMFGNSHQYQEGVVKCRAVSQISFDDLFVSLLSEV